MKTEQEEPKPKVCDQCGGTGFAGPSPETEFTCTHCDGSGVEPSQPIAQKEEVKLDSGMSKEYFLCDPCEGTGRNPAMSTIQAVSHPDCPYCYGRGWVSKCNYKSPYPGSVS